MIPGMRLLMVLDYSKEKKRAKDQAVSNEASSFVYKLLAGNPATGIICHWKVGERAPDANQNMNSEAGENGRNKAQLYLNSFKISEGFWIVYTTKGKLKVGLANEFLKILIMFL